jgi:broad specificity phosphatase PhoE
MVRSQETAAPLIEALNNGSGVPVGFLAGLNEINAGIFEGLPVDVGDVPLGGALYLLAPA